MAVKKVERIDRGNTIPDADICTIGTVTAKPSRVITTVQPLRTDFAVRRARIVSSSGVASRLLPPMWDAASTVLFLSLPSRGSRQLEEPPKQERSVRARYPTPTTTSSSFDNHWVERVLWTRSRVIPPGKEASGQPPAPRLVPETISLRLLDRRPHEVPPLRPGAVVVPDVRVTEEVLQDEPRMRRSLLGRRKLISLDRRLSLPSN